MKWWGWILSLLPAGVGITASIFANNESISNPVFFLRGSLAALASRGGVIISVVIITTALIWNQRQKRNEKARTSKPKIDSIKGPRSVIK